MIVIMDMSTGSRLDDEESLPFANVCLAAEPPAQVGNQLGLPQLGLQLAVPEPAPRSVQRAVAPLAVSPMPMIAEEVGYRH